MISRCIVILFCIIPLISNAQNADCSGAIEIIDPSQYCSNPGEFSNELGNTGISVLDLNDCWDQADNDVWFRFIANSTNVKISVTGNTRDGNIGGTLLNPQVQLFAGDCSGVSLVGCESDISNDGMVVLQSLDLIIGESYIMRIDGRNNTIGSFTLCVEELISSLQNDECSGAIDLGTIGQDGFCSEINEYNNFDALPSPEGDCVGADFEHDVWFSFVPTNSALFVQLFGRSSERPNNISSPAVAIYSGSCGTLTEVACNQINGRILEIVTDGVPIGVPIFIRIDGSDFGNFDFCIRSFPPVPSPESDCPDAVVLCDKSSFIVPNLNSTGSIQNELTGPCVDVSQGQEAERASVWYAWTCQEPGTLTFVLNPNNPNSEEEDLDWVLYELPNGYSDCQNRVALRCMLSGETNGNTEAQNAPCLQETGLMVGETDIAETAGCSPGDNNFLAPVDMEVGKAYALIVNNFSPSGYGFSIEFGGTGTFEGADPNFDFELSTGEQVVTCDSEVVFTDLSKDTGDPITGWNWNFGEDADEQFKSGEGPHNITFNSIGEKDFTLTVVTERGCEITETKTVLLEDCCVTTSDLMAGGDVVSLICPGGMDGRIFAKASGGDCDPGEEQYMFSIDGITFQESPLIENLNAGPQTIYVMDCKGCLRDVEVIVGESPEIIVDAGIDTTLDLGEFVRFGGSFDPPNSEIDSIIWTPEDGFDPCDGCLDPNVQPQRDQIYTLTIVDKNGCRFMDDLFIETRLIENVYEPNIITADGGTINTRFFLGAGISVAEIQSLRIFDQWGNLVFESFDMPLNDESAGWDGTFNGKPAEEGIYAYVSKVRFINDNVKLYKGTITLLR